jgi:hypothetical protein
MDAVVDIAAPGVDVLKVGLSSRGAGGANSLWLLSVEVGNRVAPRHLMPNLAEQGARRSRHDSTQLRRNLLNTIKGVPTDHSLMAYIAVAKFHELLTFAGHDHLDELESGIRDGLADVVLLVEAQAEC